jgi:hypothetical protein
MATLNLIYETRKRLSCSPCGSDVYLCVDPALTANGSGLVFGQLYKVTTGDNDCRGNPVYQNWIQYDDAQLEDPTTPLTNCDIDSAFCAGCLVDYINWRSSHPVVGGLEWNFPSAAPVVGQQLQVSAVTATSVTFVWVTPA